MLRTTMFEFRSATRFSHLLTMLLHLLLQSICYNALVVVVATSSSSSCGSTANVPFVLRNDYITSRQEQHSIQLKNPFHRQRLSQLVITSIVQRGHDQIYDRLGVSSKSKNRPLSFIHLLRGGASSTKSSSSSSSSSAGEGTTKSKSKKKKKKKKKATDSTTDATTESKEKMNEILKDEDSAANALGDAIRQNAHLLLQTIDDHDTLESLGYAMGSSDYTTSLLSQYKTQQSDRNNVNSDSRGSSTNKNKRNLQMAQELTSPTAVIVQYFLKSHGGVHALQCLCSLLASIAGMGSILIQVSKFPHLQHILIQRTLLFGLFKHITGLLSAIYVTARTIPVNGFTQATQSIQTLIHDPISQYVFYTMCVLFWLPTLPKSQLLMVSSKSTTAPQGTTGLLWWQQHKVVPVLLVGPVLLREVISISFVISDVLTLLVATTISSSNNKNAKRIERLLQIAQSIVDAGMSVLVTPNKWRTSNAVQRQAILAKLVFRMSLIMEIAVGVLILADTIVRTVQYLFVNTGGKIGIVSVLKSILCTQLYIQFLWVRRTKITKLAQSIRGGAMEAPLYMLNVLLHPTSSMGIDVASSTLSSSELFATAVNATATLEESSNKYRKWIDYIQTALDIGDEK